MKERPYTEVKLIVRDFYPISIQSMIDMEPSFMCIV